MKCPSCGAQPGPDVIRSDGVCPYCGASLSPSRRPTPVNTTVDVRFTNLGWEYKSKWTLFGLPVVHIAVKADEDTGRPVVAKGIIAIGNVAVGVFALGGVALGGLAVGGVSFGALAVAGIGIGVASVGGMALGAYAAAGGLAISLGYAVGGVALAPCAMSGAGGDPACFEPLLEQLRLLPGD